MFWGQSSSPVWGLLQRCRSPWAGGGTVSACLCTSRRCRRRRRSNSPAGSSRDYWRRGNPLGGICRRGCWGRRRWRRRALRGVAVFGGKGVGRGDIVGSWVCRSLDIVLGQLPLDYIKFNFLRAKLSAPRRDAEDVIIAQGVLTWSGKSGGFSDNVAWCDHATAWPSVGFWLYPSLVRIVWLCGRVSCSSLARLRCMPATNAPRPLAPLCCKGLMHMSCSCTHMLLEQSSHIRLCR